MCTNEIINALCNMAGKYSISSLTPWQKSEINNAQTIELNKINNGEELLRSVKLLSSIGQDIDWYKTDYFCLVNVSKDCWKVYVLDRFYNILGRLEDYEGKIEKTGNVPIEKSFRLRIQ